MRCIRVLFFPLLTLCVICKIKSDAHSITRNQLSWVVDDLGCATPEDDIGICANLSECDIVKDLITYPDYSSEEDRDVLRPYACGVDDYGNLKVCCPLLKEENPPELDHTNHKNLKLLPKNCGRVQAWGIYSGNQSNLFEFGWSALLKYEKSGDPYLCGGTLINDRYILTAAQCIQNRYKLIGVRLGEMDIRTDRDCTQEYSEGKIIEICSPPPQDFRVSIADATIHPKYDSRTYEHNIALIRLRHKADVYTESVFPICLPVSKAEKEKEYKKYTAIGWGATEYGTGSNVLVKVVTERVDNSKCRNFYVGVHDVISEESICTYGERPEAFCAGDYGGTLMGYYTVHGKVKTIQYGIVSLRLPTCQGIGAPTVHTKVSLYVGWILDNIRP